MWWLRARTPRPMWIFYTRLIFILSWHKLCQMYLGMCLCVCVCVCWRKATTSAGDILPQLHLARWNQGLHSSLLRKETEITLPLQFLQLLDNKNRQSSKGNVVVHTLICLNKEVSVAQNTLNATRRRFTPFSLKQRNKLNFLMNGFG